MKQMNNFNNKTNVLFTKLFNFSTLVISFMLNPSSRSKNLIETMTKLLYNLVKLSIVSIIRHSKYNLNICTLEQITVNKDCVLSLVNHTERLCTYTICK